MIDKKFMKLIIMLKKKNTHIYIYIYTIKLCMNVKLFLQGSLHRYPSDSLDFISYKTFSFLSAIFF